MILWNDFILPDLNLANVKEELIWRTLETWGLCNSFANRELNLIEKYKHGMSNGYINTLL